MLAVRTAAARIGFVERKYGRLDLMSPAAACPSSPSLPPGAGSGIRAGGAFSVATGRVIVRALPAGNCLLAEVLERAPARLPPPCGRVEAGLPAAPDPGIVL